MYSGKKRQFFRRTIEEIGYYLSSTVLFNLIYALKVFGTNWRDGKAICTSNMISFSLAVLFLIIGLLFTNLICRSDHSVQDANTAGETVEILSCQDITSDSFFSKYSLLVLTGNSLPVFQNFASLTIYSLVFITIGLIFVSQEMYYLNPILTLRGYKTVRVECKKDGKNVNCCIMFQSGCLKVGTKLQFLNTGSKIVRLKELKEVKSCDTRNQKPN